MTERLKRATPLLMGLLIALMVLGGGVGVYMSMHHEIQLYGGENMQMELVGCAEAEGVNCDIVNTSEWSEILGVPLFTWALPTYLSIAWLAFLVGFKGRREHLVWIALMGLGATLFSGFLYYISVVQLGYVCLWCFRLYGINTAILALSLAAGALDERSDVALIKASVRRWAMVFLGLAVASIAGQKSYRARLMQGVPTVNLAEHVETVVSLDDPEGTLSVRSFEVLTEEKNQASFSILADDPWKGNPDASVVVVEFADLECGYCKRTSGQLRRLYENYGDRVLFVFKNYPMDPSCNVGVRNKKHRSACKAAIAARCAKEQGRFWAFHDLAFKNQHRLRDRDLRTYAETVELDLSAFDACVRSPDTKQRVIVDTRAGKGVDIHGTPRIFINGRLYRAGSSAEQMAFAIERALGHSDANARVAIKGLQEDRLPVRPIPKDVPEMQTVNYGSMRFQIDTFESALVDLKAVSEVHQIPATRMSWYGAKEACEAAGKRMCTEREWIAACQSKEPIDDDNNGHFADDLIEGNAYPYSDFHQKNRCWDAKDRDGFRPVYTGEMPGCVSPQGVYDLTGNVEEWVGDTPEQAVLLGGAYDTSKDHARCYRPNTTFGAGYGNQRTGFRCCRTLE